MPRVLFLYKGATRNRTGDEGVADLCLTSWLWRRMLLMTRRRIELLF